MTTIANCGTCRYHDRRDCHNNNGRCKNADSPRFDVVTGPQGLCAGYGDGEWRQDVPMTAQQCAEEAERQRAEAEAAQRVADTAEAEALNAEQVQS